MKTPRWIEQPRALAALTLAFALVPAAFAYLTFKAARERDAKLFDTAAEVLSEQLKLSTFRHVSFLNVLRNQWRVSGDQSRMPPGGWQARQPHLLAVAYVANESEEHLPIRWQEGRSPVTRPGDNLASDPVVAALLKEARMGPALSSYGVAVAGARLVVVDIVPDANDLQIVRGYVVGWIDLRSLCSDSTIPLLERHILQASAEAGEGLAFEIGGEGNLKWTARITRGPEFSREYGTPTPWVGFAALGLSVLPLGVLVMLASRAGKLRAALEAEQLKNQFVSTVSHEFRTPLSVILSGAELLEAHAASLSETRRLELLTQIKASTNRMNEMVEQVLLLGRIESGTMKPNPQPVDVVAFCREIVDDVQTTTQNRCEIATKLMEGTRPLDVSLMRSVLTNLLTNAVKYSQPRAKVTLEAEDSRFVISDSGIGIPAAEQARLGEPFHRASNVGEVAGTGLGLTVVKRCIALCGGTLTVSSEEGRGTQVVVTLPS